MLKEHESLLRYRLALVAAGVLWSTGGLFIKTLTVNAGWQSSAAGITFHRSLFAAICLLPLLRGRTRPRFRDTLVAVVFYALLLGLYVSATQGTSAANAIFLQYTAPLYALVLGPLCFGEKFERSNVPSLALAMVGIGVLFFGNINNAGGTERGPLLMGAGSGLMFGLFLLWMRRMRHADPFAVTSFNNAGVALLAGGLLLIVRPEELLLVPRAMLGRTELAVPAITLVLMGCIQIAAPYVLFSYGLRGVSSVEASLLALVEPLLNPIWVALFAHERPSLATVIGGGTILAALAVRYVFFRPRAGSTDT